MSAANASGTGRKQKTNHVAQHRHWRRLGILLGRSIAYLVSRRWGCSVYLGTEGYSVTCRLSISYYARGIAARYVMLDLLLQKAANQDLHVSSRLLK